MRILRTLLPTILLGALACNAASYTYNITSSTSGFTISHTAWSPANANIAVGYRDANGHMVGIDKWSFSVNGSNDVTLTFSPSVSSGMLKLVDSAQYHTSNSTDFQVTTSGNTMTVCSACTATATASRSIYNSGHLWQMKAPVTATADASFTDVVRAYIDANGLLTFAVANSSAGLTISGEATLVNGVTGYPAGSVPLGGSCAISGNFTPLCTVSDDRPCSTVGQTGCFQ